jgi:hypothetical protein
MHLARILTLLTALPFAAAAIPPRQTCIVPASGTNKTDDAPAIISAFKRCGRGGKVVFQPTTYYVNSAMNISWLRDVDVDIQGKLLVRQLPLPLLIPRSCKLIVIY